MKFKYSAIGDNTQDNREYLEKLGYKPNMISEHDNMLYTREYFNGWMYSGCPYMNIPDNYINCLGNPQLFQAVTAISTTTDIGKHYINNHTGQCKRCDYNMATDENIDWNDWSEATLSDLIAHF